MSRNRLKRKLRIDFNHRVFAITTRITFRKFHILISLWEGVIDSEGRRVVGGPITRERKAAELANVRLMLRVRANCAESFNFLCKWRTRRGNGSVSRRPLYLGLSSFGVAALLASSSGEYCRLFHPHPEAEGRNEHALAGRHE